MYHFYRYNVKPVLVAEFLGITDSAVSHYFKKLKNDGIEKRPMADPKPLDVIIAENLHDNSGIMEILKNVA